MKYKELQENVQQISKVTILEKSFKIRNVALEQKQANIEEKKKSRNKIWYT